MVTNFAEQDLFEFLRARHIQIQVLTHTTEVGLSPPEKKTGTRGRWDWCTRGKGHMDISKRTSTKVLRNVVSQKLSWISQV